jgi:hypothetical protein
VIHESVIKRIADVPEYRPINMPKTYEIADMPAAPPEHEAVEEIA